MASSPTETAPDATPVILDCDPGHDDMVAILLAAADPRIDLRAITVVAGNGRLQDVVANARSTCAMGHITGVPVAAGAAGPLVGVLETAPHVHGESALDGAPLPDPALTPLSDEHAVTLMARLLGEAERPVTLVAVGPLTNVALLLRAHPEAIGAIGRIAVMGGGVRFGNVRPLAEFNILTDPEAAEIVFASGLPITLCPLDVTHQALATAEVIDRITRIDTPLAHTVVQLLTFFADRYEQRFGLRAPPVHDPVAVASVIDPSLLRTVSARVDVELTGTHTRGATVCDLRREDGRPGNAEIAMELDAERFWDLVIGALETYERRRTEATSRAPSLPSEGSARTSR